MKTIFPELMIAPCGMNCGTCIGYLREKNKCPGCRTSSELKPSYCKSCIIINCEVIKSNSSGFCYECDRFPCRRLKQLDKRYRSKYHTSFIENLLLIKDKGIDWFLKFESDRRTCNQCGAVISVHRDCCPECKAKVWEG